MMMSRVLLRLCLYAWAVSSLATGHAQTPIAQPEISAAESAAALNAMAVRHRVVESSRRCAVAFPDGAHVFRFFEHFWAARFYEALQGADMVWTRLPAKSRADAKPRFDQETRRVADSFSRPGQQASKAVCNALLDRLASRQPNTDSLNADDAKQLSDVFRRHGGSSHAARDNDFTVGCMKRAYNTGSKDFDGIERQCTCITDAMLASASSEEIDAWLSGSGAGPSEDSLSRQPWFAKFQDKVLACKG